MQLCAGLDRAEGGLDHRLVHDHVRLSYGEEVVAYLLGSLELVDVGSRVGEEVPVASTVYVHYKFEWIFIGFWLGKLD